MSENESLIDIPPCPGCGVGWDGATLEYTSTTYEGETWHLECAWEDDEKMERVGDHEQVRELLDTEDWDRLREMVESGKDEEVIEVVDAARRPEGHGARFCPNCWAFAEWRPVDYDYPERRHCQGCGQTFVDDPDVIDSYDVAFGTIVNDLNEKSSDDVRIEETRE